MEHRLNFEGVMSHILKAKQSNKQIGKILYTLFIKTVKKINLPVFRWNHKFTGL